MNLTPEGYLILNGALVTLVVVSYVLIRRGYRQPVKLRLKQREPDTPESQRSLAGKKGSRYDGVNMDSDLGPRRHEKALNVIFNYNGHSWDAYEVLGLPAGSSKDAVQQAYSKVRQTLAKESEEFVRAAYDAIMKNEV